MVDIMHYLIWNWTGFVSVVWYRHFCLSTAIKEIGKADYWNIHQKRLTLC